MKPITILTNDPPKIMHEYYCAACGQRWRQQIEVHPEVCIRCGEWATYMQQVERI